MDTSSVTNNAADHRYELRQGDGLAELQYQQQGSTIVLIHTFVPPEMEGQGIGSALARAALEDARAHGWRQVVLCPFVRSYLLRHPEYQDDPDFYQILSAFDEPVQELAMQARGLIFEAAPEAVEVPWIKLQTIGYGIGTDANPYPKRSQHFAWLSLHLHHVDLGFNEGSLLPDPAHLLQGTGQSYRHVKIRQPHDLRSPGLRELLQAAVARRTPGGSVPEVGGPQGGGPRGGGE